jgi:hypothetical protein
MTMGTGVSLNSSDGKESSTRGRPMGRYFGLHVVAALSEKCDSGRRVMEGTKPHDEGSATLAAIGKRNSRTHSRRDAFDAFDGTDGEIVPLFKKERQISERAG